MLFQIKVALYKKFVTRRDGWRLDEEKILTLNHRVGLVFDKGRNADIRLEFFFIIILAII